MVARAQRRGRNGSLIYQRGRGRSGKGGSLPRAATSARRASDSAVDVMGLASLTLGPANQPPPLAVVVRTLVDVPVSSSHGEA